MIALKIYRNDEYVVIDNVLQGVTIDEVIDETLDQVVAITHSSSYTFELYDSIRVDVDDQTSYYLINDINQEERLNNLGYKTTLTLIEPTKYLEKIIVSSQSKTDKRYTLEQQIINLLFNAELLRFGETPRFSLSSALMSKLSGIAGEDFFFDKLTLRECLDMMLSVIGCRCVVKEITDFNDIEIDYYSLNEVINTIAFASKQKEERTHNVEYLGMNIEAFATNTFTGDRDLIYHPSPLGWTTFKTKEATLTTSNATIQTAFPIELINEFIVKGDFDVVFALSGSPVPTPLVLEQVDLTRNVVDKETWDLLPSTGGNVELTTTLYQENTIYYVREQSTIQPQEVKVLLFFSASSITQAVKNAIFNNEEVIEYLEEHPLETFLSSTPNITIANAIFRIKYQPYIDAHVKVGKRDYREVKSTIINSQSDKTVDLKRFGIMLEENINRLGNQEINVDNKVYDVSELYEVGDALSNGYIIIKRVISVFDFFIKARYTLSNNYNEINKKIGIDRKRQLYNIPIETFNIDILAKYIISFSKSDIRDDDYHELIDRSLDTLISTYDNKPLTNVLIRTVLESDLFETDLKTMSSGDITYNEGQEYISYLYELPMVDYQIGKSCLFTFKMEDNFSVGMSSVGQIIGGIRQIPNPYVNNLGEYFQIWLRLFNDENATRSTSFDIVKLLPKTSDVYYSGVTPTINDNFIRIKDRYEHHSYTVQVEFMSIDNDIVITDYLAVYNSLINLEKEELTVYRSDTLEYKQNDKLPLGSESAGTTISFINGILILGEDLEDFISVGIADSSGNLIIGINKSINDADVLIYTKCEYER